MNIESVREYCLSLPLVAEAFPFDEQTLVFRILGKDLLPVLTWSAPEWVTMKCNADYALELREVHPEIEGAWHWNKKYWNRVNLYGTLEDDFIQADSPQLFRSGEETQEKGADGASGNAGCEGIGRIIHFFCSLGNACFQDSSYLCTQKS